MPGSSLIAQAAADGTTEVLGVLQDVLEYAGTIAFAISGAMLAARKRMDIAGVVVMGCIVGVGGGTLRDLLLGEVPVFWVASPTFILVAALTAIAAIPLHRAGMIQWSERYNLIVLSDAAGMALFVITSANVAFLAGASPISAAILGVIGGVGGGIIRDLLANEVPDVLRNGEYYATAAFVGALLYVALVELDLDPRAVFWIPIAVIFGIRVLSISRGWGVPVLSLEGGRADRTLDHPGEEPDRPR
ncbi:trimeric intracellular cation channel family protein [Ilumatobacter nonamiensis]|uniref:trimeric intracellular cation channel family protein n=1 Tax=Ilumatobacter nonamiensis TaxID=467093 RepID=UPI000349ADA0|nr:trimeric intracellular cation channel family protein [Ilumatobacter nonamiensis]